MIAALCPEGDYMMHVSEEYAAKALRRGECARTEEGHLVVIPQPLRTLTPEEKRRHVLARERAKR